MAGFGEALGRRGIKSVVQGVPGSFNVHLGIDRPVASLADTQRVDAAQVETLTWRCCDAASGPSRAATGTSTRRTPTTSWTRRSTSSRTP